jgi:hypothetical protein
MEKPNIVKCAICEEYYTRDAMCEATVSGRYERVCLTCLHKIESRSQQALGEDTSGPESEEPIEESESEE